MKYDISKLEKAVELQSKAEQTYFSPYNFGLVNGLICALALIKGEKANLLATPPVWGQDAVVQEAISQAPEVEEVIKVDQEAGIKMFRGNIGPKA